MIITINTKEDSKDEIKRAIQMLMRLVEHQSETNDFNPVFPGTTDAGSGGGGIFGLFDNTPSPTSSETEKKESDDRIEIWEY